LWYQVYSKSSLFPSSRSTARVASDLRLDPKYIDSLAQSIRDRGLIHPPVITRDGTLVAGECRITAIRQLGWDQCPVQFVDDLSEFDLRAIELEENVKRRDISWQDQVRAVEAYHTLRQEQDPSWTQERTAEAIGYKLTQTQDLLRVGREMKANPKIADAPKLTTAVHIAERNFARQASRESDKLEKALHGAPTIEAPIITADFHEWAASYTGPKFNFLHCDFPYGINASEFNQGSASKHGGYVDSPDAYFELLRTLVQRLDSLLEPSAHVIFWFSMKFYYETLEWFNNETDFDVTPFPLVWLKSDNSGILPRPQHGPRQIYETAFFGFRGQRPVVQAKSNAYAAPSVREEHMSVKPEPMLRHFFEMVVDSNTVMLDPTAGSGSALRAADSLKARRVVGIEKDPEFAERANDIWIKAKKMRSAA
jgi:hypothetical protein